VATRARVSKAEYLAELNRRLQQSPAFEPGMRFVFAPLGADEATATGYTWLPDPLAMHPFAQVATSLATELET
jgi:hypothetical protein